MILATYERMEMVASESWVGVEDLAYHLGVAKNPVYRWIDERGLPAYRVGRLFLFKSSEIDEWVRRDKRQEKAPKSFQDKPLYKSRKSELAPIKHSRKRDGNE